MKRRRQSLALRSLSRVPPSSSEAAELHEFYLKYGQGHQVENLSHDSTSTTERVWMGDTVLEKCMLMFPQERKYVHTIFNTATSQTPTPIVFIKKYSAGI